MTYQVADGHNNAAGYADIDPQPASDGIQTPRRSYTASGVYDDGRQYIVLRWNVLTDTELTTVLTAFGLADAITNEVTVSVPGEFNRTFVDKNGTAVRPHSPELGYRDWYNDIEIRVIDLEDTA
ncbi:MAG: hypothetical protein WC683_14155 [bacterium]